jgi:hypothetical protein
VFKIFEKIEKLNPSLKIVIATNGTVLNYKVKEWLNKLNIHINLSIDSLTPEIYETIRVNAKFDRMMEHFAFYHQYCKENNRTLCIMVNPMRNNWHEMPEFIRFVNKHKINIWFNTIHRPVEWAIWPLPSAELSNIYKTLSEIVFTKQDRPSPLSAYNISIYKNLVDVQFKNWLKEAQEREAGGEAAPDMLSEVEAEKVLLKKISDYIYLHFNEGEEQKQYHVHQINEKLKLIEKGLLEKNINLRFYTSILSSPPDVLYNRLNSSSAQQLQKEFEHWFSQEVSV